MLALRAAQIQEVFCAFDLGSRRGERHECLCKSCARAHGILSIVIVIVLMENEVRFFWWWLFFFQPCLIKCRFLLKECPMEVLADATRRKQWCLFGCSREVAPIPRCDARVFPPLCTRAGPNAP